MSRIPHYSLSKTRKGISCTFYGIQNHGAKAYRDECRVSTNRYHPRCLVSRKWTIYICIHTCKNYSNWNRLWNSENDCSTRCINLERVLSISSGMINIHDYAIYTALFPGVTNMGVRNIQLNNSFFRHF